jgi:hypothetical protein
MGDAAAWNRMRGREALWRVRRAGIAALLILACAAGWLGWREVKQTGPLPGATAGSLAREDAAKAALRLKQLAMVIYLAKVRENALLIDVTGEKSTEAPCMEAGTMTGLPADSPCAAMWDKTLAIIWRAAFGDGAPPVPDDLKRDPWGAPYLLEQSEASCGRYGAWCPPDSIRSAGPDGAPNTADDVNVAVPHHLGPSRIKAQP